MDRYKKIREEHTNLLKNLKPVSQEKIEQLKDMYGDIPEDYVEFLREIGAGSIGNEMYKLYGGFLEPTSVFGSDEIGELRDYHLIADDYAGCHIAFNPRNNWSIVEIEPGPREPFETNSNFTEFITELLRDLSE